MKIKDSHHIKKCRSCRFFVEFANNLYRGWCHKHAPLPNRGKSLCGQKENSHPPVVSSSNWCGEHELFNRGKSK